MYFSLIKAELSKTYPQLRKDLLDECKYTWGTIYSKQVMNTLCYVHSNGFKIGKNVCDSICASCDGNINNKCIGEATIQEMDRRASELIAKFTDYEQLIQSANCVCDMCGTKEKCSLIIRATK